MTSPARSAFSASSGEPGERAQFLDLFFPAQEPGRDPAQSVGGREGAEVQLAELDGGRGRSACPFILSAGRRGRPVVLFAERHPWRRAAVFGLTLEHVGPVGGQGEFEQEPGEATPGLDQGEDASRGQIETLQHPLPVQEHLAYEPVPAFPVKERVEGGHGFEVAPGLDHELPDPGLVQAQVEQGRRRVRAREGQRPEGGVSGQRFGSSTGRRFGGAEHGQARGAELAVEVDPERGVDDRVRLDVRCDLRPGHAVRVRRAVAAGGQFEGSRLRAVVEGGSREQFVDEVPFHRSAALDSFFQGAEEVDPVAADAALVEQSGQSAGAGEHPEERNLGQGDGGSAVVGEQDAVAGEREFVAAAGSRAADRAQVALPGVPAGVLDRQAGLVRELAEVHLQLVGRGAEHADVRAGAEDPVPVGAQHDCADLRVLEAEPLCRVVELEVDSQIVGVLLELVAGPEPRLLVDFQGQEGERRLDLEPPVAVAVGVGAEVDRAAQGGGW